MRSPRIFRATAGIAALALVATLSACSQPSQTPPSDSGTADSPVATPSPQVPTGDMYAAASQTVTTVMTEYFDTDRSQKKWFSALEPYLSADAQYAYEDSNMGNIPDGNVTGVPQLRSDDENGLTYAIATTEGDFTLVLVLEGDEGGDYAVDEIKPPGSSGSYD